MKRNSLFVFFFFTICLFCCGMTPQEKLAAKVLDEVWQEVSRNHFRKDFDAAYRKNVYEKHRPAVLQTRNIAELTAELNKMLEAIGDSHLRVYGPDNREKSSKIRPVENPGPADTPADPGFTVLTCGKELQVRDVRPGSAAAEAGIRPGDVLLNVEGWDCKVTPDTPVPASMIASALLERGGTGSLCAVRMRGTNGQERALKLVRSAFGGKRFQAAALPPLVQRYETRMLTPATGYLRFNFFTPDVVRQFRKDRRHGIFKKAQNLVVDLRGNPGGILLTAEWLGAWCFPQKLPLGTMTVDGVKLTPVSEPQKKCFNGKVIILTDCDSASTSELFAAAVQDGKAGLIMGGKTSGKCLPSMFLHLPSGFMLQTVSGDIRRPSGKGIERVGVTPDILMENSFKNGQDQVLAKATALLAESEK